jgi:NAD(P)-dependent dehydrogenase (short-subunit alcohol dehydrogenase family)
MKLSGKVAIVTGSGRGLGRSFAISMAGEGASVVVLSRTFAEVRETARVIRKSGGRALALRADVSILEDIALVVEKAVSEFGAIDILVNNAGVVGPVGPLHMVEERQWDACVGIDLKAVFLFSRAAVPQMIRQGGGKIINLTSGLAEMVMPPFGVYSIAKGGVNGITRYMAEELRPFNIQVNGLDPGVADTPMQEGIRQYKPEVLGKEIWLMFKRMKDRGELRPPEEVARLAVFLASSESDGITGEIGTEAHYRKMGYRNPDDDIYQKADTARGPVLP